MSNVRVRVRARRAMPLVAFVTAGLLAGGCDNNNSTTTPAPVAAPAPAPEPDPPPAPEPVTVPMYMLTETGNGEMLGTVQITDSDGGAVFTPDLSGLTPGAHGFHVHQNGDCGPSTKDDGTVVPGGAAGGHYDPEETGVHLGPDGDGHLGDLPVLVAADDGTATGPVTAPRIRDQSEIAGLALMIHAGGDNYSDEPAALGGGGARFGCGVLEPEG